jgi:hypothetical protein
MEEQVMAIDAYEWIPCRQGSCQVQHSEPFHSSSPAYTALKTVQQERLGHCCSQKLTAMPSASVQSGSTTMEVPG